MYVLKNVPAYTPAALWKAQCLGMGLPGMTGKKKVERLPFSGD
jgi:hypothetical protein